LYDRERERERERKKKKKKKKKEIEKSDFFLLFFFFSRLCVGIERWARRVRWRRAFTIIWTIVPTTKV
jgi:hypothetical protein